MGGHVYLITRLTEKPDLYVHGQHLVAYLWWVLVHTKFYIEQGGRYYDITPVRKTTTASVSTINLARTDGSATITVTDTGHGAEIGDFVTFAGFTTLGGGITADVLNTEHEITAVTSANVYTFYSFSYFYRCG